MTPTDLAYLAGLLDSIGRVRIHETAQGTRLPAVGISSPNMALLSWCAHATGVRVTTVRRTYDRLGCSEHCADPHLHVRSITGRWNLVGARAAIVLRSVRPYLVNLAHEVDTVLAETADAPHKGATVRRMAALGWDAA